MENINEQAQFTQLPTKPMMKTTRLKRFSMLLALSFAINGHAQPNTPDAQQPEEKLMHIRSEIQKITSELEKDLGSRNELQNKLSEIEKELNLLNQERRKTDRASKLKQQELHTLNNRKHKLDKQLVHQRSRLADQVVSAYKIGRQEQIKLVLNQTEPEALNRVLNYYRYFNQARLSFMASIAEQVVEVQLLKNAISTEMMALKQLNEKMQQSAKQLDKKRLARKTVLTEINQQISKYGVQIDQLKADERRVRALIQSITNILDDIPETIIDLPFLTLKGQLNWPTQGTIQHKFGEKRGEGDLLWQGLAIAAPAGQAIHAISHGRVAFSDWLQGFGLLLIIDHQDGFMSLYAHNETLYKETGDWVNHGDTISSVGSSGGLSKPRLYLEIRHQGAPINPESWFKHKI